MQKVRALSDKQLKLIYSYLNNDQNIDIAAMQAGYHIESARRTLKYKHVAKYIDDKRAVFVKKLDRGLNWKRQKLCNVVDASIPDDQELLKGMSTDRTAVSAIKNGLTAIQILNNLDGDNAPTKSINISINSDLDKVDELRQKYRRDY